MGRIDGMGILGEDVTPWRCLLDCQGKTKGVETRVDVWFGRWCLSQWYLSQQYFSQWYNGIVITRRGLAMVKPSVGEEFCFHRTQFLHLVRTGYRDVSLLPGSQKPPLKTNRLIHHA